MLPALRRHTPSLRVWSSDVFSSVLPLPATEPVVTARLPPVVVIEARPLLVVLTAPVTFKPPVVSFSVNAPLVVNRSEERRVGKGWSATGPPEQHVRAPVVLTVPVGV